jgi:protease II
MLEALQHLSEHLYSKYKGYTKIEREAVQVSESKWNFGKWLTEGELKRSKETAHEMFLDIENIAKIRKYTKLPDEELAEVLRGLPGEVQNQYAML